MGHGSRDRVTVDLRGMRDRLRSLAAARNTTTAALLRKAIATLLDSAASDGDTCYNNTAPASDSQVVKVTLRLCATDAISLATRARAADVSQGAYVSGLICSTPPAPVPRDHAHAVAALVASTDQLAAMGADLNAFMRLLGRASSSEIERYRSGIMSLADDVRKHLALASPLVAELRSARRPR